MVEPLIHLSLINSTNVYYAYTKNLVHGIQESQSSVENTCYNKALHMFLQPFLHTHTDVVASFYHYRTWCKKNILFHSELSYLCIKISLQIRIWYTSQLHHTALSSPWIPPKWAHFLTMSKPPINSSFLYNYADSTIVEWAYTFWEDCGVEIRTIWLMQLGSRADLLTFLASLASL